VGTSKADKMRATQDMLILAIVLGFFPLNFSKNPGGQIILAWGNGGVKLPEGVSPTAITRRLKVKYAAKHDALSESFSCFKHNDVVEGERKEMNSADIHLEDRLLCLQQDVWSNLAQDAFLGNMVTGITVGEEWEMFTAALGVTPFSAVHSAANTLALTEEVLKTFGLKLTDMLSCTTDTASNAFNAFDPVDFVAQAPCFAHLIALLLKHAFEYILLLLALEGIHDLVVLLRASPKRKTLLMAACTSASVKYLAPILDVITRWNSKEAMVTRFEHLFPALTHIVVNEAFDKPADRLKWNNSLARAEEGLEILRFVMPFMKETSQWTQILSRRDSPTSSLVRLATMSIKRTLDKMELDIRELAPGATKTSLIEIQEQLVFWAFGDGTDANKGYIGEEYSSFWAFRVAEFLDCRTYKTIAFSDKMIVTSELLPSLVSAASVAVPRRRAARAMTDEERYLDNGAGVQPVHPLEAECKAYMIAMRGNVEIDPLVFWAKYQHQYPILAAVARRVLAIPATSSSSERLFSAGGRVCTFDRSSRKPATVDILTTMHVRENSAQDDDRRSVMRQAGNDRFCTIKINESMDIEIVEGTQEFDVEEDGEFEDDDG